MTKAWLKRFDRIAYPVVLGALFVFVFVHLFQKGGIHAALGWYAIILIPGGFGRLIWSDRPLTEWLGWCMVAAGTAIFIFSPIRNLIAGFAGVLSFMQLVVRLIPFSWFGRKRQPNEGPDEDGDNGDVNGA